VSVRSLSAFALAVAVPTLAAAQVRVEVGPLAALYAPTGSFEPAIYYIPHPTEVARGSVPAWDSFDMGAGHTISTALQPK